MTRVNVINGSAAVLAVVGAVVAATVAPSPTKVTPTTARPPTSDVDYVMLADGRRGIEDASGTVVPVIAYRRILSGSTVSDAILAELCEPDRVVAYTARSRDEAPWRHKFAGKDALITLSNLEAVLALKPDLVIADNLGDPRRLARLREAGIAVFDIGTLRGVASWVRAIHLIGGVLDRRDRAALMAARYMRSLESLADDVPEHARPEALYVSSYAGKLYGGTRGTNYHDVLHYAGLRDVAAARYKEWPEYSIEALLVLDPPRIVTRAGTASDLCNLPGLHALRACTTPGAIIELEGFALSDPGLGILDSAEALFRAVHGE